MRRVIAILLMAFFTFNACAPKTGFKTPRKAHYKTKEGKKKQKFYNQKYRD